MNHLAPPGHLSAKPGARLRGILGLQTAEGRLPERLAELVPVYLSSVPLDHFDGRPLRYVRDRRIVYSIGRDLVDAGGANPANPADKFEPTASLAF